MIVRFLPSRFRACAAFAFAVVAAATFTASAVADSPWPMAPRDEPADGRVLWKRLDNGLRFAAVPGDEAPGAVSLRLVVEAGLIHEPKGESGLAILLEHMAYRSASALDWDDMRRYLLSRGVDLDARFRSRVSSGHTVYDFDLEAAGDGSWEMALKLLAEIAGGLEITDEQLERERAVVEASLTERLSEERKEQAWRDDWMYEAARGSTVDFSAMRRTVQEASAASLSAYWKTWYRPDRMTVFVTGDVDAIEVSARVEELFGTLSSVSSDARPPANEPPGKPRKRGELDLVETRDPVARVVATVISEPIDLYDPKQELRYFRAGMVASVAQAEAEAAGPRNPASIHRGRMAIGVTTRGNMMQLEDALRRADMATRRLYERGVSAAALEEAKAERLRWLGGLADLESERALPIAVAERLVDCLMDRTPFRVGPAYGAFVRAGLDGLTPSVASELAKEIFDPKRTQMVVFVPEAIGLTTRMVSRRLDGMRSSYNFNWDPAASSSVSWTVKPGFGELGMAQSTRRIEIGPYTALQYAFQNSARMNVLKADVQPGRFAARLSVGNGATDMEGVLPAAEWILGSLLARTVMGEREKAPKALEVFAANGLEGVRLGANLDQLYIDVSGNSDADLFNFFSLATELLVVGHITEEEFDAAKEGLKRLASVEGEPRARFKMESAMFADEPRLWSAFSETELDLLTYERYLEWFRRTLRQGYIELSVVGDVDSRIALREARKTFAALPTREGKVILPRHGATARLSEPGTTRQEVKGIEGSAYASYFWPLRVASSCQAEFQSRVLRLAMDQSLRSALKESPGLGRAREVDLLGHRMAPQSPGLRIDLRVEAERLDEAEELALKVAADLHTRLTPDEVAALEAAVRIEALRARRSLDGLLRIIDQAQGKPDRLECHNAHVTATNGYPLETYQDFARLLLRPQNARVSVATPAP